MAPAVRIAYLVKVRSPASIKTHRHAGNRRRPFDAAAHQTADPGLIYNARPIIDLHGVTGALTCYRPRTARKFLSFRLGRNCGMSAVRSRGMKPERKQCSGCSAAAGLRYRHFSLMPLADCNKRLESDTAEPPGLPGCRPRFASGFIWPSRSVGTQCSRRTCPVSNVNQTMRARYTKDAPSVGQLRERHAGTSFCRDIPAERRMSGWKIIHVPPATKPLPLSASRHACRRRQPCSPAYRVRKG